MNKWDKENLGMILSGHGNYFDARLLRLICESDRPEMEKLHQVYPEHVEAVYQRQNGRPFVPSGGLEDHQRIVTMSDGSSRVMGTGAIMS